jgi:cell division septation protein DedD
MHDEFRIDVEVQHEHADALLDELRSLERGALADIPAPQHVAVSQEHGQVFLYADSEQDAAAARAALEAILAKLQIQATPAARRWHPEEERWEDISAPLPSTPAEHVGEHERLEQTETEESEAAGHPQWEVRVTLPTHHDAREFAERLQSEGYPLRRHWRHIQLGARDEDDANALAARLRAEAPQGSEIEVEGDAADAWAEVTAPARPFSIFGGFAQ